jgi:glutathione S-transferase
MHRYTTKHDDDLRLGSAPHLPTDDSPCGGLLREWLAVLNERLHHVATTVSDLAGRLSFAEDNMADVRLRLAVVEERLSHTATSSWVLGCAVAVLAGSLVGTLGGFWWIVQQYIGPLLQASAS